METEPPPPSRRRRLWLRVLLVLLLLIAGAELALRFGWGFGRPPLLQADPEIGYLLQPDQDLRRLGRRVRINAFHQRSEAVAAEPPAGTLRVLCVGDSVTWGGVQTDQAETFPELLAGRLRARPGAGPVEVLNASAGSWGPGNELAYLKRFGTFGSRWVVLQVGSDDFNQPTSTGELVGVSLAMPDRNPASAIGEVAFRYVIPRLVPRSGGVSATESGVAPVADRPADAGDRFARNLNAIRAIAELTKAAGAKLILLHTPDRADVVPDPVGAFQTKYDAQRERLLDLCRELDVPVVNIVAAWRGRPEAAGYFRDWIHPNPAGNGAIAAELAKVLTAD